MRIRNNTRGNFNKHDSVARGFIKINECIFVYTHGMHCIIGLYYEPWRRKARRKGFKED